MPFCWFCRAAQLMNIDVLQLSRQIKASYTYTCIVYLSFQKDKTKYNLLPIPALAFLVPSAIKILLLNIVRKFMKAQIN